MTSKQFVILMVVCTILCWGSWLLVLTFINPETTSILGFALFYLSLFFALTGALALLGYLFRWLFTRRYSKSEEVTMSFRQAIFFAFIVSIALFLQGNRLLTWVNAIILVALVTMIEFLFISLKKNQNHEGQTHKT